MCKLSEKAAFDLLCFTSLRLTMTWKYVESCSISPAAVTELVGHHVTVVEVGRRCSHRSYVTLELTDVLWDYGRLPQSCSLPQPSVATSNRRTYRSTVALACRDQPASSLHGWFVRVVERRGRSGQRYRGYAACCRGCLALVTAPRYRPCSPLARSGQCTTASEGSLPTPMYPPSCGTLDYQVGDLGRYAASCLTC